MSIPSPSKQPDKSPGQSPESAQKTAKSGANATASSANSGGVASAMLGQELVSPQPMRIAELCLAASEYVHRATGCELDESEESLAFVDYYLASVTKSGALAPQVCRLVASALGTYLGELAIRKFGGRWLVLPLDAAATTALRSPLESDAATTDAAADPAKWRLELEASPVLFDPIGMAALALQMYAQFAADSPEDALAARAKVSTALTEDDARSELAADDALNFADDIGFFTTPELTEPLRAAMVRLPQVSADYYYSLTGRFETLSYVVDMLGELRHLKAQGLKAAVQTEADATSYHDDSDDSDEEDDDDLDDAAV